jgi:ketosteroid isomerase-like protein
MPDSKRLQLTRAAYAAFDSGDRQAIETLLSEDLRFFSPPDPGIDLAGYFERCWPHAGRNRGFEFKRLVESGDEVIVTYESAAPDGTRFRNTEILTFRGDQIVRQEIYFGWNLEGCPG